MPKTEINKIKIKKVLLINPPYTMETYLNMDNKVGAMQHPVISLASIAGALKDACEVKILDLDVNQGDYRKILAQELSDNRPEVVGITATTPVFPSLLKIAEEVKNIDKEILVAAGGVHVTVLPEDALSSGDIDIVIVGEADFFMRDFIESRERLSLKGAYFKQNGKAVFNGRADLIEDLDTLPYPAWRLFDLTKYKATRLFEHNSPGGLIETSRGCPFRCIYCSKQTFGTGWRKKSVKRVVGEFRYMKEAGFRELHIEDDGFSTDLGRAKVICEAIIKEKIKIPWTLLNGIRVDRVDQELFSLLKESGCYQVAFGIESGDTDVLKRVNKGITLMQIKDAVKSAHRAGLKTCGFFIFGLIGETKDSVEKTIALAKSLPLDLAKFAIATPYPGTPFFEELDAQARILHRNWGSYRLHNTKSPIFKHPSLSWDTIQADYKKAYRKFYLRPVQLYRQFINSIKNRTLLQSIFYLIRTKWY